MKRWLLRIGVAVVVVLGGLLALERYAAESGEVVVLHARAPDGSVVTTRLWVVDHQQHQYLRVGADGSGWYARLTADPAVELARGGQRAPYLAVAEPESSAVVNDLMADKYGWRDAFIGALVGGRDGAVPVRLDPR